MLMKDRTKNMFAAQLEEMLKTMSLEKVRVVELCKRCGATPPTFYYHFRDKYELVAWMFLRDVADSYADQEPDYSAATIAQMMQQMERHRLFYKKAYAENSQNSINRYVQDFNIQLSLSAIKKATGSDSVSQGQMLAIKYHAYGVMGLFREWLFGDLPVSCEDLAGFQYSHTPDFLQAAFRASAYERGEILRHVSD